MAFDMETLFFFMIPFIIVIVGILGNIITVISFYYAKCKQKYGFHETWNTANVHILNLAVIDFMYCLIKLIHGAYDIEIYLKTRVTETQDLQEDREDNSSHCTIFVHLQILLATSDKCAIILIAVTRAFAITNNLKWKNFCDKKRNVIILILFPWAASLVICSSGFRETFYKNVETGLCVRENVVSTIIFKHLCLFGIETTIILLSYFYIFLYITKQFRGLKTNPSMLNNNEKTLMLLRSRNIRVAKTMAIIAFSSIFLCLPLYIVQLLYMQNKINKSTFYLWALVSNIVWNIQYSNNVFIYVWRKDEYMWAIMDIISIVLPICVTKRQKQNIRKRWEEPKAVISIVKDENLPQVHQLQRVGNFQSSFSEFQ